MAKISNKEEILLSSLEKMTDNFDNLCMYLNELMWNKDVDADNWKTFIELRLEETRKKRQEILANCREQLQNKPESIKKMKKGE
jgi:hypothetical protein